MRMVDLITAKRDGNRHTSEQISWLIESYTKGDVPDYQMAAWCMAALLQGLDDDEAAYLTMAMASSGDQVDLSAIPGFKLDKHSTGGVADTTTLVLGPLVAACGAKVAKMSGRGLGHTGGTIDKLESIPGFKTEFTTSEFLRLVDEVGIAVAGQSAALAPADKKLYALRDATGTVESMGLIAASIMSKKLASGADGIMLDVKTGRGAFMKTYESSKALASLMVNIGRTAGRKMEAAITDMDQPLGSAIGNALEVREAIDTLSCRGPERLNQLCRELGGRMLVMAGIVQDPRRGQSMIADALTSGQGLQVLARMIEAQGGNPRVVDKPALLPSAAHIIEVKAGSSGHISELDSLALGHASVKLGAGRARKEETIDPAVGIVVVRRTGESVDIGDVLAVVHANNANLGEECKLAVLSAYRISETPVKAPPLIYEFIA